MYLWPVFLLLLSLDVIQMDISLLSSVWCSFTEEKTDESEMSGIFRNKRRSNANSDKPSNESDLWTLLSISKLSDL